MSKILVLLASLVIAFSPNAVRAQAPASAGYDAVVRQAFEALRVGDHERLKDSIEAGLDPYATNLVGVSLADDCLAKGDFQALEMLLQAGYDANHPFAPNRYLLDYALRDDNRELIQSLLSYGADPALTEGHDTPLHTAAGLGDPEVLKRLLQDSMLVNTRNAFGESLLHSAVRGEDYGYVGDGESWTIPTEKHLETIALLLNAGLDIDVRDDSGRTPLFDAADYCAWDPGPTVVKYLLDHGADPNARDNQGETPLLAKGYEVPEDLLELLLDYGADINAADGTGGTLLHRAASFCDEPERFAVLADHGAELNARDSYGYTPLHLALVRENREAQAALLDLGAEYDLAAAACEGDLAAVQGQAAAGNVIEEDPQLAALAYTLAAKNGYTDVAEFLAAQGAPATLETAMYLGDAQLLEDLLAQGADANQRFYLGRTALHLAAERDDATAIALLADHGATLDSRNDRQETPLLVAVRGGNHSASTKLLALGADPNLSTQDASALSIAVLRGDTEICRALLQSEADASWADLHGRTPLFSAVSATQCDPEIVDLLIAHGADPNARDETGQTPLFTVGSQAVTDALIKGGADLDAKDDLGYTPLSFATWANDLDTLKLLLESGADPNTPMPWGATPFWWAKAWQNDAKAELLEQYGGHDPAPEVIDELELYGVPYRWMRVP